MSSNNRTALYNSTLECVVKNVNSQTIKDLKTVEPNTVIESPEESKLSSPAIGNKVNNNIHIL